MEKIVLIFLTLDINIKFFKNFQLQNYYLYILALAYEL